MTQGNVPAGWYDDGQGAQRWWDGSQWTDHTQPAPSAAPPATPAAAPPAEPGPTPAEGVELGKPAETPPASPSPSSDVTMIAPAGAPYPQPGQTPYTPPQGQQPAQPPYQQPGQQPGQQQPYGQQAGGYPPQPGQAPSWQTPYPTGGSGGGGKGKLFAIIGGGAALVLIVLVVLFVVVLGGGGPKGVAEDYINAQTEFDIEKVCNLSSERLQKESFFGDAKNCKDTAKASEEFITDEIRGYLDDAEFDVEIGDVTEDGDTAEVKYTLKSEYKGDDVDGFKAAFDTEDLTETNKGTLKMVKEDGEWKVDEDNEDS